VEDCFFGLTVEVDVLTHHYGAEEGRFFEVQEVYPIEFIDDLIVELILFVNYQRADQVLQE
jgi:hypothetical protein